MRRFARLLALLGFAAVVAGCGGSSTFSSALPQSVQQKVLRDFPKLAYVPTVIPSGAFFKDEFSYGPDDLGLEFSDFSLTVTAGRRCSTGSAVHSFRMGPFRIGWSGREEDQSAWRCISPDHLHIEISANASLVSSNAVLSPEATLLARIVAHAKYIGPS